MPTFLFKYVSTKKVTFLSIIAAILLCQGCASPPETLPLETHNPAPASGPSSACIKVEGKVSGDLIPNSTVSLYETSSVGYSIVMTEIRALKPVKHETINASKRFTFRCLFPGNYAFVIPSSSYSGAVGFPLPYEFDCPGFSLEISFQGGDPQFAVGAFSITDPPSQNRSLCVLDPESCLAQRGSLYKKCPLD